MPNLDSRLNQVRFRHGVDATQYRPHPIMHFLWNPEIGKNPNRHRFMGFAAIANQSGIDEPALIVKPNTSYKRAPSDARDVQELVLGVSSRLYAYPTDLGANLARGQAYSFDLDLSGAELGIYEEDSAFIEAVKLRLLQRQIRKHGFKAATKKVVSQHDDGLAAVLVKGPMAPLNGSQEERTHMIVPYDLPVSRVSDALM